MQGEYGSTAEMPSSQRSGRKGVMVAICAASMLLALAALTMDQAPEVQERLQLAGEGKMTMLAAAAARVAAKANAVKAAPAAAAPKKAVAAVPKAAAAPKAAVKPAAAPKAAREAARALCAKYGIVTGGGGGALEKRNEVGETPLIQAAADGAARSVRCLLAAGAAVHATDTDRGRTALSWAAGMGSLECVEQLLEQGAEVEAADKVGRTSLMWSAYAGHDACLARLLEAKVRGCALLAWPCARAGCEHARGGPGALVCRCVCVC